MTFNVIIGFVAMFAIGFWAGMQFMKNKMQKKINRLRNTIDELENPEPPNNEQGK